MFRPVKFEGVNKKSHRAILCTIIHIMKFIMSSLHISFHEEHQLLDSVTYAR